MLTEPLRVSEARDVPVRSSDHHVSAILAKPDVRSRGEAAAFARRLGV